MTEITVKAEKVGILLANPGQSNEIDIYLKKEAGIIYPCDKNGSKITNLVSIKINQEVDSLLSVTLTAYVCGWIN